MRPTVRIRIVGLFAFVVASCVSSTQNAGLKTSELANILGVKIWRVPEPEAGREWEIDVVNAESSRQPSMTLNSRSGNRSALISLRPLGEGKYEFTLRQQAGQASGQVTPCAEPEGSEQICEGYSIEFFDDPLCVSECQAYAVASLKPMIGSARVKQIIIRTVPSLSIRPSTGTVVIPVPR